MHPTRNLFKEFPNRVFVETGSYRGDSIQLAMEAGFETIVSMDIDPSNTDICCERFKDKQEVSLLTGDSATKLLEAILHIDESITLWLDAHAQYLEDEPEFPNPYPLLAELEQIRQHNINTHTIIIDDILHLTHPDVTGWSRGTIELALKNINSDYKFTYYANPVKNNILVAYV